MMEHTWEKHPPETCLKTRIGKMSFLSYLFTWNITFHLCPLLTAGHVAREKRQSTTPNDGSPKNFWLDLALCRDAVWFKIFSSTFPSFFIGASKGWSCSILFTHPCLFSQHNYTEQHCKELLSSSKVPRCCGFVFWKKNKIEFLRYWIFQNISEYLRRCWKYWYYLLSLLHAFALPLL